MSESVCPKCGSECVETGDVDNCRDDESLSFRAWKCKRWAHYREDGSIAHLASDIGVPICVIRELTNTVAQQAEEIVRLKEEPWQVKAWERLYSSVMQDRDAYSDVVGDWNRGAYVACEQILEAMTNAKALASPTEDGDAGQQ